MADAGDKQVYLAGAVAILSEYPVLVMEMLADPRTGTKVLKDYPSLKSIRVACDVLYEPIEREQIRKETERQHALAIAHRPVPLTAEEIARRREQVARCRQEIAAAALAATARGNPDGPDHLD
jgi:hypothetical protein